MKLNLIHKIVIAITAAVIIFCTGFYTGYLSGETTITINGSEITDGKNQFFQDNSIEAESKININTASTYELELLPGIGPALAQAIIEYRESNGNFETIEDIKQVKGISDSVFTNICTLITV